MSDEIEYSLTQGYKALRIQPGSEGDDVLFISVGSTHTNDNNDYGVTIGVPIQDVDFVIQMLQRAAGTIYQRQDRQRMVEGCAQIDGSGLGAAFAPGLKGPVR